MKRISVLPILLLLTIGLNPESAEAENNPHHYDVIEVEASVHDGNVPENTLDDNLSTRWSAQGEGEYIQYDLGSVVNVGYMGIAFHSGDLRSSTIDIELSTDGETWSKSVEQQANSGEEINLEPFDFEDQEARYVRIVGYGNSTNDWNSLTAVHIYAPNEDGAVVEELEAVDPGPDPDAEPFTKAGLYFPDSTEYSPHEPNPVTGETINVIDYGADPENNDHDDTPAINAAIEAANPGDEVYFPNGTYHLRSTTENDFTSNLYLKNEVNLRGETEENVELVSHFDVDEVPSSKVMTAYANHDIMISDLTITSTFDGSYSDDPGQNNPERGGPAYGIFVAGSAGQPSYHLTIDKVTVEKFQRMGIRFEKSNRNIVSNSTFKNATDVGGGGAGYGVGIQGIQGVNRLGHSDDTYFNLVAGSHFEGPYMRHGTLIQNFAHNNLVEDNTYTDNIHDAIDLHGQGEYLNKISHNKLDGVPRGGIGVGNTGGTPPNSHSASGAGNVIHGNHLKDTRDGITVIMGSPDTVIENNKIMNTKHPENARGIYLKNAPGTIVENNKIINNKGAGFWGILITEDAGDTNNDNKGAGTPEDIKLKENKIIGNTNGMKIEDGRNIFIQNNNIRNNIEENYVNLIEQ
ncbi:right-handed parallel beta-helix repeat-containing protein [Alteribacillus sp. HJP-4]|uniref:right-handed parallel beta-helix repeat-containing protein n=1 Tax=Alteribacillus sp. HJP-4 TaxID=2775394 RepID=UPI0035CD11CC